MIPMLSAPFRSLDPVVPGAQKQRLYDLVTRRGLVQADGNKSDIGQRIATTVPYLANLRRYGVVRLE